MVVKIRLMRLGKKKYPKYRIIVIEEGKKRNGSYIEKIGFYDPMPTPVVLTVDKERLKYWQGVGAQLSEGARKILK